MSVSSIQFVERIPTASIPIQHCILVLADELIHRPVENCYQSQRGQDWLQAEFVIFTGPITMIQ